VTPASRRLLPIGRFAVSVRLSVKALRHYDELGLLEPAFVDAATGYRYYAPAQAREALLIGMLRELELPLATIRRALRASPEELRRLLAAEAERLERELSQRARALRSIQHLARAGSLAPYEIGLARAESLRVARRTIATTVERLVPESSEALYALLADLRREGWEECGPILCENEDPDPDGRQVVHVCAAVGPAQRLGGAALVDLPGGDFARLLHVGPFESLGLAYHALHAFAQERGHERRGPMREIYRNDPAEVPPEAIETEVWMPV
jgi:DNA-binding transcriptional MerR regulator